jgi:hypothetical protein
MANLSSTGTMTTERLTSPSHRIRDDERGGFRVALFVAAKYA